MKDTNNNSVAYCPPNIRVIEINLDGILCQSGTYGANGQNGIWEDPE